MGGLYLKPWKEMTDKEKWEYSQATVWPIGDRQYSLICEASRDGRIRYFIKRQAGLLAMKEGKERILVKHVRCVVSALRAATPEQVSRIKRELGLG